MTWLAIFGGMLLGFGLCSVLVLLVLRWVGSEDFDE